MTARMNLLLMAVVLLCTVAVRSAAAVATMKAGGGEVRGEGYVGPKAAGRYSVCRTGCPDAFWNCNDWCLKSGYKNGGVCVPPQRQKCCCVGQKSS